MPCLANPQPLRVDLWWWWWESAVVRAACTAVTRPVQFCGSSDPDQLYPDHSSDRSQLNAHGNAGISSLISHISSYVLDRSMFSWRASLQPSDPSTWDSTPTHSGFELEFVRSWLFGRHIKLPCLAKSQQSPQSEGLKLCPAPFPS
jgi:hypothetical protein